MLQITSGKNAGLAMVKHQRLIDILLKLSVEYVLMVQHKRLPGESLQLMITIITSMIIPCDVSKIVLLKPLLQLHSQVASFCFDINERSEVKQ